MMTFFSYAKHLGISQGDLALRIVEGNLAPDAVDQERPGFRSMYFNAPEVSSGAESDREVTENAHDNTDVAALWECFRSRLVAVCSAFKVPDDASGDFQIFTSNRKLAMTVRTETSAFCLGLTLHPELTRRRWGRYQGDKEELHRIAASGSWTPTVDGKGYEVTFNVTTRYQAQEMAMVLKGLKLILA